MAVDITTGEISAIRLLRTIDAHAPPSVRDQFHGKIDSGDYVGFIGASVPLLKKFGLPPFTYSDLVFVTALTDSQQDVCQFYAAIKAPAAAEMKVRIDGLMSWAAWESIARIVKQNDKIPFHFSAQDIARVFDPTGLLTPMPDGQAQAKTFLYTIYGDPRLKTLADQVKQLIKWGGFETVAHIVVEHPEIPFRFSADDLQSILDPEDNVRPRSAREVRVLAYWDVLQRATTDRKVAEFFNDLEDRVRHGCWRSIADILNGLDNFPLKPIQPEALQEALDPSGQNGDDQICDVLKPPEPPAWTKPIVWSIGAGLAAYGWTTDAAGGVEDWTLGTAGTVKDWTTGAASAAVAWSAESYGDAADWTAGSLDTVEDWTTNAAATAADWGETGLAEVAHAVAAAQAAENAAREAARNAVNTARDAAGNAIIDTANQAADWIKGAGGTIASWFR